MNTHRQKYICYLASEYEDIVNDGTVYECESYVHALETSLYLIGKEYDQNDWHDETVRAVLRDLIAGGAVDMRNGRFLYIILWDGRSEPVGVARKNEKKSCGL